MLLNRKRIVLLGAVLAAMLVSAPSSAWQGKVSTVADGSTLVVLHDGKAEKVRLFGIASPLPVQEYGEQARKLTSEMVGGKEVQIDPVEEDSFGGTLGIVTVQGQNLNRKLIEQGLAWVYRAGCDRNECNEWKHIEAEAKFLKRGLWASPSPVAPWEFRVPEKVADARENDPVVPEAAVKKQAAPHEQPKVHPVVYHGNPASKVFHAPDCPLYNGKHLTVVFKSKEEALKAGYQPHRCITRMKK